MERTEENLMEAINEIGEAYAIQDKCGVEIYPNHAEYVKNPDGGFAFIVSDEYTSFGDVFSYGFNDAQAYKIEEHELDLICDEIHYFIYGGGKYAVEQLVTA